MPTKFTWWKNTLLNLNLWLGTCIYLSPDLTFNPGSFDLLLVPHQCNGTNLPHVKSSRWATNGFFSGGYMELFTLHYHLINKGMFNSAKIFPSDRQQCDRHISWGFINLFKVHIRDRKWFFFFKTARQLSWIKR